VKAPLLLKNLVFTVLVPGTVAIFLPLLIVAGWSPVSAWAMAPGIFLFGSGAATYTWCVWSFATFGNGTPVPIDAPKRLVVWGPYRCTRNPMYAGVLIVILGWSILFHSGILVLYTVIVGISFHLFVALYEEPHLEQAFGNEYREYCKWVGRWLPRFRHKPVA
jgi:protein-S-isoprenylcysteine O-methyltransferase Ste14